MTGSASSDTTDLLDCRLVTRAAGLSLDPCKLLLGGLALLILETGLNVILRLPFAEHAPPTHLRMSVPLGSSTVGQIVSMGTGLLLTPLQSIIGPGLEIFRSGSSWPELATAWTRLLWALLVWSLFGGAIARMAAVQFATGERIGVRGGLKFALRQLQNYMTAPFLPLAGIGCLLAFNVVLGAFAGLLGSVGETILGVAWGLVLFCGFLMALLVISVSVGWPLMVAAVSTEDSDGFDGLGRANGFLLDRPWRALLLVLFSLPVFALGWLFVATLLSLTAYMADWAVAAGAPGRTADLRLLLSPSISAEASPKTYWLEVPRLLLWGFGPSFFWCGITVIYFLLRKSDDGTPLDDVTIRLDKPAEPKADPSPETPSDSAASAE
jgi:hypothetical protein